MAAAWGSDGDRLTGEVSQLPSEGERGGARSSVGGVIAKDVGVGQEQGWAALSPSLPEGAHPRPAELYRC